MWYLMEEYIGGFSAISKTAWLAYIIFSAAICLLSIVGLWRVFEKAGEKGWKALIPIYNIYIMFEIAWSPKAFLNVVLVCLACVVDEFMLSTAEGWMKSMLSLAAFIAVIYVCVMMIRMYIRVAKAFGHGVPFGLGLYFLEVPFIIILGFDKSKYEKPRPDPDFEESPRLK